MKKPSYGSSTTNTYGSTSNNSSSSGSTSVKPTTTGITSPNNQTSFSKKQNTFQVSESVSQSTEQASFKKNKVADVQPPVFRKTFEKEENIPAEPPSREFKKEDFHIGKKMGKGQFG